MERWIIGFLVGASLALMNDCCKRSNNWDQKLVGRDWEACVWANQFLDLVEWRDPFAT